MSNYIAVDIGGTQLRAALYPLEGLEADKITKISTRAERGTPLDRLTSLIEEVWPVEGQVKAICVAVPGPTDPFQGVVIDTPNIPGWENLPLQFILENRFGVPVALGNDANLAALAEWRYGAGEGHHDLLFLTISTGIGSGIIVKDKLLLGARGLAGELGHVTVIVDGPLCGCGKAGHLEAVASGTAMLRWIHEQLAAGVVSQLSRLEPLSGIMVTQAAKEGDELAIRALARSGEYMGIALASHLHIFNPTAVVIGGGVSQAGELLFIPLRSALEANVMAPQYLENLVVAPAAFGDEAGLVGALTLARHLYPA